MDTRKHIAIRQETHALLKSHCTQKCLNMGAYIDRLIRNELRDTVKEKVKLKSAQQGKH